MRDISLDFRDGATLEGPDAILNAYEIALFTSPTEFSADPEFGFGLLDYVGEVNNEQNALSIRNFIVSKTKQFFPEIEITKLEIFKTDTNTISIQLDVTVIPYAEKRTIQKEVS